MQKREIIWRAIATDAIEKKTRSFQQKELAGRFLVSLSTVSNALKPLRAIGAVHVGGRSFQLTDLEKLLTFWATHRKLQRDILYKTHVADGVREIESAMPPEIVFGVYTAYRLRYHDVPADYDKVYVYATDPAALKQRFPKQKGYENLIVLKADPLLSSFGPTTPAAQLYVDLWNLPEWYAADFLKALKARILPVV